MPFTGLRARSAITPFFRRLKMSYCEKIKKDQERIYGYPPMSRCICGGRMRLLSSRKIGPGYYRIMEYCEDCGTERESKEEDFRVIP